MTESGRHYVDCPGSGRPAELLPDESWMARCPECAFAFTTLMDAPTTPRHWWLADGSVRVTAP